MNTARRPVSKPRNHYHGQKALQEALAGNARPSLLTVEQWMERRAQIEAETAARPRANAAVDLWNALLEKQRKYIAKADSLVGGDLWARSKPGSVRNRVDGQNVDIRQGVAGMEGCVVVVLWRDRPQFFRAADSAAMTTELSRHGLDWVC